MRPVYTSQLQSSSRLVTDTEGRCGLQLPHDLMDWLTLDLPQAEHHDGLMKLSLLPPRKEAASRFPIMITHDRSLILPSAR